MLAYLDAGTGSMVVAAAAAGAAGVATVGRMAWYKVSPKKRKKDAEAEAAVSEHDTESLEEARADVADDAEADATS